MNLEARLENAGYSKEEAKFLVNAPQFDLNKNMLGLRLEIVKNYINYTENTLDLKPCSASLSNYLVHFSTENIKVKPSSAESLSSLRKYDFSKRRKLEDKSDEKVVESFTHGMPTLIKKQVANAKKLIPLRTKIAKKFIQRIANNLRIKPSQSSLTYFLTNFNANGDKVEKGSSESLQAFHVFNFIKRKQHAKLSDASTIDSFMHELDEDLKQQVIDATLLTPQRIQIVNNFLNRIETDTNINPREASLTHYLYNFNIDDEDAEEGHAESLVAFYKYDFIKQNMHSDISGKAVIDSLTYRLSEDLKQRVIDATQLTKQRIKILHDHIARVENNPHINPSQSSLVFHLLNYSLEGEGIRVKICSSKSLQSFYKHDFSTGEAQKELCEQNTLDSIAHGLSAELKQKVIDATQLVKLRTQILQNFVQYKKDNPQVYYGLSRYLQKFNAKNDSVTPATAESMNAFSRYDFEKRKKFNTRSEKNTFISMTYNIKDKDLVAEVKKYCEFKAA